MTNDLSTLSGALLEMKDQLIYELGQKGVTASYDSSTGLLGLISKIGDIQTGGSCYHIELDNSSYTTSGSLTVSATVLKNYSACVGETVTFTSSTSTTTTATTDSNGVATATISFSGSTTLTASIGGVSDTATVTVQTYLFRDGAVTGDYNSDYIDTGTGIVATVGATGTNISCTAYADRYRRANALLNGDFRITVTCVQTTDNGFDMALLNTSNSKQYNLSFAWYNGKDWNNNGSQLVSDLKAVDDSPIVMERVGSTLTVKCNGTQLLTRTITTNDLYFAWKTHSQGGRNCTFKDLTIEAL